jgi:hypothetical protein
MGSVSRGSSAAVWQSQSVQNILPRLPAITVTYAVGARASARRHPKHPSEGAAKASPHIEEAGAASCAEDEPKANADASATNVRALIVSQYSGGCRFVSQ